MSHPPDISHSEPTDGRTPDFLFDGSPTSATNIHHIVDTDFEQHETRTQQQRRLLISVILALLIVVIIVTIAYVILVKSLPNVFGLTKTISDYATKMRLVLG